MPLEIRLRSLLLPVYTTTTFQTSFSIVVVYNIKTCYSNCIVSIAGFSNVEIEQLIYSINISGFAVNTD